MSIWFIPKNIQARAFLNDGCSLPSTNTSIPLRLDSLNLLLLLDSFNKESQEDILLHICKAPSSNHIHATKSTRYNQPLLVPEALLIFLLSQYHFAAMSNIRTRYKIAAYLISLLTFFLCMLSHKGTIVKI